MFFAWNSEALHSAPWVVPTLPSPSARHCIAHDGYGSNSIASICCEFVVQQIYNNLDDTPNAYNMHN